MNKNYIVYRIVIFTHLKYTLIECRITGIGTWTPEQIYQI